MTDNINKLIKSGKLIPFEDYLKKFSLEDQAWIKERARYLQTAMAIRHLRRQLKLTQKELADRMHVKREVIARAESGQHNVTLETLYRIGEATNRQVTINFQ